MNKVPVLDKGYVGVYSSSIDDKHIRELRNTLFRGRADKFLLSLPKFHLMIRSPLFVQLSLTQHNITCVSQRTGKPEAYIPSVNDVGAKDLETAELIQNDIKETTEALLLNPKAYQMDACDVFVSQVITPISTYNTYLASAELTEWLDYVSRTNFPEPVKAYASVILDLIKAEWPSLGDLVDVKV